jgi:hypothetical protein
MLRAERAPPVPVALEDGEPELAGAVEDGAPVVPKPVLVDDGEPLVERGVPDEVPLPVPEEVLLTDLEVEMELALTVVD